MQQPPIRFSNKWKLTTTIFAFLTFILGALGFCGWVFDNTFLRTFLSDGASMKTNTSLMIMIAAISLWLINKGKQTQGRFFIGLLTLLSILIIIEQLFNVNLSIDELIFKDPFTNAKLEAPGRTSLLTSISMLFVAVSMFFFSYRRFQIAQLLACGVFVTIYISLMGHLFHINGFYSLGRYSGVAFHTALAIVLLSVGIIIASPQKGWMEVAYQRLGNKRVHVYILSYLLVGIPLFAAIYLFVIENSLLSASSNVVILIALTALLSLPIAYLLLRLVNLMDSELLKTGSRLEVALDAAKLGSYDLILETGIMNCSDQCKKNYGLPADVPFNFPDLLNAIVPEHRERIQQKVNEAIENRTIYNEEYMVKWPNGSLHWVNASGKPSYNEDGKAISIAGVTYDITVSKNYEMELQQINEEMAASNEELIAVNEEQAVTNEQLQLAQDNYLRLYNELSDSQDELLFAISAASLGTWDYNPQTNKFKGNDLLKSWFGLDPFEEIDLSNATNAIIENDRQKVIAAITHALDFNSNGNYDIIYTIVNPKTSTPKIVRAQGRAVFNEQKQATRFSGTLQDITEQVADEQRKNDFIGMVSHELKTPLTSLSAIIQVLNQRLKNSDDNFVPAALEKAIVQLKKMSSMINGFLNVSRLESGKIQIIKQNFDLGDLLKEVIKESEVAMAAHIIRLDNCGKVTVNADRDKISSVISNFLSNAVKYSAKGSAIEASCTVEQGRGRISIKDYGIGIKPQDKDKLFDRYYRVEDINTKHISGFGIGLYLSAEIIHRHEGKIWLDSEWGVGSTFYFELNLS